MLQSYNDWSLQMHSKVPLQGEELEAFLAKERAVKEKEAAQQAALDTVVTSIQDLRLMGKHDVDDVGPSQDELSAPDPQPAEGVDIEVAVHSISLYP